MRHVFSVILALLISQIVAVTSRGAPNPAVIFSGTGGQMLPAGPLKNYKGYVIGDRKNYVTSPDDASGWVASGAGVTVTTETTAANLADSSTRATAVKVLWVSGSTAYARTRWTLDPGDVSSTFYAQWDQHTAASAGNYHLEVWATTDSTYASGLSQLTCSATNVPTGDTTFQVNCTTTTARYLELRVVATTSATALYLNNIQFFKAPFTVGSISGSSNASGATLTGGSFQLTPADATNGGVLTNGTQSIKGAKTTVDDFTLGTNLIYTGTDDSTSTGTDVVLSHPTGLVRVSNASLTSVSGFNTTGVVTGSTVILLNATGASITLDDNFGGLGGTIRTGSGANTTLCTNCAAHFTYWAGAVNRWYLDGINRGVLSVADGGTGASTLTSNGVVLGHGTSALTATTAGSADQVLRVPGAGGAPAFGAVDLSKAAAVTSTLAVGNGGTGATTLTSNGVLLGNTTSAVTATTAGSANQVLRVPGAGGAPAFGAIDLTQSAAVTGALPIANGGTNGTTAAAGFDNLSPMSALGDIIYGGASGTRTRLAGNTTSTNKFLTQTGTGSVSAAPGWNTIVAGDLPTATADAVTKGATTSFAPTIKSSVKTVSSANYTILDNDGYSLILVTAGGADRTITLPAAANNAGRVITIRHQDAPGGRVIIDGNGSETIDGALTNTITMQYSYETLVCDGSGWEVLGVADYDFNTNSGTLPNSNSSCVSFTFPPGTWSLSYELEWIRNSQTASTTIPFTFCISTTASTAGCTEGTDYFIAGAPQTGDYSFGYAERIIQLTSATTMYGACQGNNASSLFKAVLRGTRIN